MMEKEDVMAEKVKDSVCGMEIDKEKVKDSVNHLGRVFYFCSGACRGKFEKDPKQYTKKK